MKKNLLLFIAISWFALSYAGTYSGGSGTAEAPYQISTLNDLHELSSTPADWGSTKYFIQTNDIDAAATSGWDGGAGFSPIGNSATPFGGSYDGQNYEISNLYMDRDNESNTSHGLFGETSNATIENLGLSNVQISGYWVGALIGYAGGNSSSVVNCYADGTASGHSYIGGLIGTCEGSLSFSYFSGSVTATQNYVGGLVGYIGYNNDGTITYCYSEGTVSSSGEYVGGLAGYGYSGEVQNAYSIAAVSSDDYGAGFLGTSEYVAVYNSYSTGLVTCNGSTVGGFLGYNNGGYTISNCFWDTQTSNQGSSDGGTGKTTAQMKTQETFTGAGWDFVTPIWDIEGSTNSGYPYLIIAAPPPDCFDPANLSADNITGGTADLGWTENGNATNWEIKIGLAGFNPGNVSPILTTNNPYPATGLTEQTNYEFYLRSKCSATEFSEWIGPSSFTTTLEPPSGDGSIGNPYLIASLSNLKWISMNPTSWDKHFIQTNNIDAAETSAWNENGSGGYYGFFPIGNHSTKFTGTYNGQNNTISNLFINRPLQDNIGLIGESRNATLENIQLSSVNISGKNCVGSICGYLYIGEISNCIATGSITGTQSYIGGIVGDFSSATLTNCGFHGTVNVSKSYAGGLAGIVGDCEISGCYATGSVSAGDYAGGLIGYLDEASITNSYSDVDVTATGDGYAGGFIGGFEEPDPLTIDKCYSRGSVSGTGEYIGGFIGYAYGYENYITDCYSMTTVNGSDYTGGFLGYAYYIYMTNCYVAGTVSGTPGYTGGLIGYDDGYVEFTNSFWDIQATGQSSAGVSTGAGKTTEEMKTGTTYSSWDFSTVWQIKSGSAISYPYLQENEQSPPPGYESLGYTWDGSTSNDWNTASNWNVNAVPSISDDVIIANPGTAPVIENGETANCNNLTINSNATLTINSGGSLITNGTITNNGTINVEHTISNGQWHLVSSPVSNATANTFLGKYLQSWSEPSHEWAEISEPATDLDAATGYLLWGTGSGSSTYTFTGTPLTGNQSKALTFTEYSADPQASEGANLVGNPYPSSIDWDLLRSTYGAVYYLDNGNYVSWSNGGSGSRYVPPLQGFFVMTNSNTTLNLTNAHRTHTGASSFYKQVGATEMVVLETNSPDGYTDKLYIRFEQEAQPYFELPRDAWKLPSFVEGVSQLWSVDPDGGRLSIDVRPATESIPVGFSNTANGTFSIGVAQWGNQPVLYLEDTQTGQVHNLRQGAYYFSHTATDNPNRFKLLFGAIGTPETATSPIRQWISGHTLYISAPGLAGQQAQVKVLGISGQKLQRQQVTLGDIIAVELQSNPGVVVVETISLDGSAVHTTKGVVIK